MAQLSHAGPGWAVLLRAMARGPCCVHSCLWAAGHESPRPALIRVCAQPMGGRPLLDHIAISKEATGTGPKFTKGPPHPPWRGGVSICQATSQTVTDVPVSFSKWLFIPLIACGLYPPRAVSTPLTSRKRWANICLARVTPRCLFSHPHGIVTRFLPMSSQQLGRSSGQRDAPASGCLPLV